MQNILVTGAFGQIGSELVPALQKAPGVETVVALGHSKIPADFTGVLEKADVQDTAALEAIIVKYKIDTIFHMVSLLSVTGEQDPNKAWDINLLGLKKILDLAVKYNLRVFWPSSIAAFGPSTPKANTPQRTVLEPTTMYGVTKVAGELLCQYYFLKYGLDVRSVRYPGLISWKTEPGGGTSDYAVAVFYEGITTGKYTFFVGEQTMIPMMYMDDAIRATVGLMQASADKLTIRTSYNLGAISFTAKQLAEEVKKHIPLVDSYVPDHRQKIADSWPDSVDDSVARADWGWQHEFDLSKMTAVMIEKLQSKLLK